MHSTDVQKMLICRTNNGKQRSSVQVLNYGSTNHLWFNTHLIDSPSFSQGANSSHVGSSSPAAMKTIPSDKKIKKKKKRVTKKCAGAPRTQEKPFQNIQTHEKRCTESHFSLMKSFRYFMNSLSVTMGSSSMLNLLSADHVSMATSTIRVLSCSLKIWENKVNIYININKALNLKSLCN